MSLRVSGSLPSLVIGEETQRRHMCVPLSERRQSEKAALYVQRPTTGRSGKTMDTVIRSRSVV